MARLGSIYEEQTPSSEPRGPDLRCVVDVYRGDIDAGRPARVRVPMELPHGDGTLRRAPSQLDDGESMELNLPPDVRSGTTLRMRGRGAVGAGGCGDLYLELRVLDGEAPADRSGRGFLLIGLLLAAAAGIGLLAGTLWGG